jgi:HK97 family phage major capsid protein
MTNELTTGSSDFAGTANGTGTNYTIPRTLLGEVINAVRKQLVLRGLAARVFGPSSIPGRTLVIPIQAEIVSTTTEMLVDRIAEGAEIDMGNTSFTTITLTPVKYGVRIGATKEMQEDGILDLLSYHAELAGYEFANNEETLIVSQLDSAASASSHTVANSNATLPISDITAAMQQLETDNYMPTHILVGAEVANDLRNIDTFVEADKSGVNNPTQRMIGTIFGMKVIVTNSVSAKLAYVIDANHAFVIGEKRPVTMERYNDFARDSEFVVCTQRIAVGYLRANAVSEITTT